MTRAITEEELEQIKEALETIVDWYPESAAKKAFEALTTLRELPELEVMGAVGMNESTVSNKYLLAATKHTIYAIKEKEG